MPEIVETQVRKTSFLEKSLDDMDEIANRLEITVPSALKYGSCLRLNEPYEIYQQMQEKWPGELKVKQLADLFQQSE